MRIALHSGAWKPAPASLDLDGLIASRLRASQPEPTNARTSQHNAQQQYITTYLPPVPARLFSFLVPLALWAQRKIFKFSGNRFLI